MTYAWYTTNALSTTIKGNIKRREVLENDNEIRDIH